MSARNDEQLLMDAGRGDREAFGELAERYAGWLLQFTWKFLGDVDRHTAEDLTQDILLSAWRAAPRFTPRARVRTWLYTLATNRCLNHRRSRRARAIVNQGLTVEHAWASEPRRDNEAITVLSAAITQLPERQRATLILRHYHEFSYAEIAEVMDMSVSAVESSLFRARLALVRRLRPTNGVQTSQVSRAAGVLNPCRPERIMRCRRARLLISTRSDGELSFTASRELDLHLAGCEPCRTLAGELVMLEEQLTRLPAIEPHRDYPKRIRAALQTAKPAHDSPAQRISMFCWGRRATVALATAAAIAVSGLAFVGGIMIGQRDAPGKSKPPAVCMADAIPTMPRLVAVKVHADWCARCPTVGPLFDELEKRHANEPVLFLTLDITTDHAREQAPYLTSNLGIGWISESRFESGMIKLLDRVTGEVLAELTTPDQYPVMQTALAAALDSE